MVENSKQIQFPVEPRVIDELKKWLPCGVRHYVQETIAQLLCLEESKKSETFWTAHKSRVSLCRTKKLYPISIEMGLIESLVSACSKYAVDIKDMLTYVCTSYYCQSLFLAKYLGKSPGVIQVRAEVGDIVSVTVCTTGPDGEDIKTQIGDYSYGQFVNWYRRQHG